jgi:predicted 2-oxoglutarate/Fe(II)-dependent dioxygenase YbiX
MIMVFRRRAGAGPGPVAGGWITGRAWGGRHPGPAARGSRRLARATATAHAPHGQELLERISASPFRVGLSLPIAIDLPADTARQRIAEAIRHLDDTIREIRAAAFAGPGSA